MVVIEADSPLAAARTIEEDQSLISRHCVSSAGERLELRQRTFYQIRSNTYMQKLTHRFIETMPVTKLESSDARNSAASGEGTSMTDLTKAMGINPPSLYATFGNKETLFEKVLDRYIEGPGGYVKESLLAPTAAEFVRQLLSASADFFTDPSHACGCLAIGLESGKQRSS
jgi:hypothetical protein